VIDQTRCDLESHQHQVRLTHDDADPHISWEVRIHSQVRASGAVPWSPPNLAVWQLAFEDADTAREALT
jgi:hypothetical protein